MTTPPPSLGTPAVAPAAQPGKSVWDSIGTAQEQDALDSISKMLTGTKMLQDEPGVVYALAQQKAQPQDAQAIDQFMQGLDAERQVRIAQAAGSKITLTSDQKSLLDSLGVQYNTVEYTQQDAMTDTAAKVQQQSGGKQQVARNADGSFKLDANGQLQVENTPQPKYKAKGIGRFFQTLHNDIEKPLNRDVASPVIGGLNRGWNTVDTAFSDNSRNPWSGNPLTGGSLSSRINSFSNFSQSRQEDQKNAGYGTDIFSTLAFMSSGKAHSDLTPLATQWDNAHPSGLYGWNGQDAVNQATQFLDNPKAYRQQIENDATLTPEQAAAKLAAISSPQFAGLARQVSAHSATVGNDLANAVGIDPTKHATTYAITAAATNLAASFMFDPTLMLGSAVKIAKISQVGINTLGDADKAAAILDPARGLYGQTSALGKLKSMVTQPFLNNVQRGWQNGIDLAGQIRDANAAGDTVREAALTAKFNAELPALAPLLPDFLGTQAITGYTERMVDGVAKAEPILGETNGIRSLADAADYVSSKAGLTRLMNGRAATQASLMPGALSSFGIRKLKGLTAEWMTTRSAQRAENAYAKVLSAAEADPGVARKMIDEGTLAQIQPEADDAINALTDQVLADKQLAEHWTEEAKSAAGGSDEASATLAAQNAQTQLLSSEQRLASARRASAVGSLALTPAGKGDIAYNIRRTGNPFGSHAFGWASPTAIAARGRLAAQRLTTLLPRNTLIDINDAASGDKLYKMAMTYLNRGDARALQAAWNSGDGAGRKAIIGGLLDQIGHAAGLGKTASGQKLLDTMKTATESYSSVGDEAILDGQPLALHAGQVNDKWLLPSFRTVHQAASKIGLWEATMGRALTSDQVDTLMSQWKLGALGKPSTVTRNQLEGWGRTALEGQLGAGLKARAVLTMPNRELWAKGLNLDLKDEYERLLADGDLKGAKAIAHGSMLDGQLLGRATVTHRLADFAPFALAGRAYREMFGKLMSDDEVEAIAKLGRVKLQEALEGYSQQIRAADLGEKLAARQATDVTRAGFGPAKIRYRINDAMSKRAAQAHDGEITHWTQQSADGTVGADRYANALAQRINETPNVARAVLDHLENPEGHDISHVVAALDDPSIANKIRLTGYGRVYWEDPTAQAVRATTPEQIAIGKTEFANKVVNDYRYLLTGQNGQYQQALAKEIRQTGRAPDADWISSKLTGDNRPHGVLAPEVMAMPVGGERGMISSLQDIEGAAYQWMVERPLQRTTSAPVLMANYAKARVGLNPMVEQIVGQGISRAAAENMAEELATRNAWIKTEQLIDDPGQKSQFDIVARNMFPFSRATQAMVRRWGSGLWQDPARARKMMLAFEGAQHSGFIYNNAYGEPTFVYPGSGVMNMLMREVAKIPGFEGLSKFPIASNMTGGVLMSVPGADNPLRMGMGPMLTIPLREVEKLFPDQRALFDEVDSFINGPIGVGQTFSQLEPTVVRRVLGAMSADQRNSALASSMKNAIANLAAGGQIPPADASPSERDAFIQNLKTQTRSQLFLGAVLGLFAPAAPSQPTEGTKASQADYAFHVTGIGQLSDEYKTILNDVHGDSARANAIWTALHPDKTVYTEPGSQANTSKVYLPATAQALQWMETNRSFIGKYKSVAAYFLPVQAGEQPFSDQAYRTQIELGLRQRKTPTEFYGDFRVRSAEALFYPVVKEFDDRITAAKATGQSDQVSALTQAKSSWETEFKNQNPLFAQKIDSYPDARAAATGQLADLRLMVKNNAVPGSDGPLLSKMLAAWDGYNNFIQQHKGTDTASSDVRKQALAMFDQWAVTNVYGTPLADLYSGVFRTLDTNIVDLTPTTGSGA